MPRRRIPWTRPARPRFQPGDLAAGTSSALPSSALGWYIDFPAPDAGYKAHRVLTQPVASYNGVVYFLTSSPSGDVCSLGGYTYLWAVNYNNGGPPSLAALSGMVSHPVVYRPDSHTHFEKQ